MSSSLSFIKALRHSLSQSIHCLSLMLEMTLKMDTRMVRSLLFHNYIINVLLWYLQRICLIVILIGIIADVLNGATSTVTRTRTVTWTATRTSTSTTTVTRLCKRSALPYIGNDEVDKFVSCVLDNGQRCEQGQAVSICSIPPCLESSFPANCKCN